MLKTSVSYILVGTLVWGALGASATAQSVTANFPTAEAAFRSQLLQDAQRPYPNYSVDSIVYSGDYAMAGWTFGEMGGVFIAQQRNHSWTVICGDGGVFGSVEDLQQFCGIPPQPAQALLQAWMNADQGHWRVAEVFDPPSNVRLTPNGRILCSVRERTSINITGTIGNWYYTDVCGQEGVIHSSQIRF